MNPIASQPPLVVDLDGTLIRTDLLQEAILLRLKQAPWSLPQLVLWALRGPAFLKLKLEPLVQPDVAVLPYRDTTVNYVREARADGRRIVLASASPRRWVAAVAAQLGLFDEVLATEDARNLKGARKLERIRQVLGGAEFDYLGDHAADLPIWRAARKAVLAGPAGRMRAWAQTLGERAEILSEPRPAFPVLRALRPHQWSKNLLVFVPLLLAHKFADAWRWLDAVAAFAALCGLTSATYVFNDLLDLEADRHHPTKRRRPCPSGQLPIPDALGVSLVALLTGAGLACLAPRAAPGLAAYLAVTLAYSLGWKRVVLVDVVVLSLLYGLRLIVGGIAAQVPLSPWLSIFAFFFFISLAFAKRHSELANQSPPAGQAVRGRGYHAADLPLVFGGGLASGVVGVLVFYLYVLNSPPAQALYRHPEILSWSGIVLFYWTARLWLMTHRRELDEDPVLFALKDRASWFCALVVGLLFVAAL